MNSSDSKRFEALYRQIWAFTHRRDEAELGQHERDLLSHLNPDEPVTLTWLAGHLLMPKSTASVAVKNLEGRGLLARRRREGNDRELAITLTKKGAEVVKAYTVLDLAAVERGMKGLSPREREVLLDLLRRVATSARN